MLKHFAICCALPVLLLASSVQAEQTHSWLTNGVPASGDSKMGSNGAFGAMLVLTDDWPAFLKSWEQPTLGFEFRSAHSIGKGQPLTSAIIFTGCQAASSGNCRVVADFRVLDPAGKTYAENKGANIWNLAPPPDKILQLSVESLGVSLDPPDRLGTYVFVASVTDRVANKTIELRDTFEAR